MLVAPARRADSADKRKGRPGKSGPITNFNCTGTNKDKGSDWRAQLISLRHHTSPSISNLIRDLHFGEARDV